MSEFALRLYVVGEDPTSQRAITNFAEILEKYADCVSGEVVDIAKDPERGAADRVIATPLLVRTEPAPVRKLIGDLSDFPAVLAALRLPS